MNIERNLTVITPDKHIGTVELSRRCRKLMLDGKNVTVVVLGCDGTPRNYWSYDLYVVDSVDGIEFDRFDPETYTVSDLQPKSLNK